MSAVSISIPWWVWALTLTHAGATWAHQLLPSVGWTWRPCPQTPLLLPGRVCLECRAGPVLQCSLQRDRPRCPCLLPRGACSWGVGCQRGPALIPVHVLNLQSPMDSRFLQIRKPRLRAKSAANEVCACPGTHRGARTLTKACRHTQTDAHRGPRCARAQDALLPGLPAKNPGRTRILNVSRVQSLQRILQPNHGL